MIHVTQYEVLCNGCQSVIATAPNLTEAREIEREGRDCIQVGGEVYCCEECAKAAKRAERKE